MYIEKLGVWYDQLYEIGRNDTTGNLNKMCFLWMSSIEARTRFGRSVNSFTRLKNFILFKKAFNKAAKAHQILINSKIGPLRTAYLKVVDQLCPYLAGIVNSWKGEMPTPASSNEEIRDSKYVHVTMENIGNLYDQFFLLKEKNMASSIERVISLWMDAIFKLAIHRKSKAMDIRIDSFHQFRVAYSNAYKAHKAMIQSSQFLPPEYIKVFEEANDFMVNFISFEGAEFDSQKPYRKEVRPSHRVYGHPRITPKFERPGFGESSDLLQRGGQSFENGANIR